MSYFIFVVAGRNSVVGRFRGRMTQRNFLVAEGADPPLVQATYAQASHAGAEPEINLAVPMATAVPSAPPYSSGTPGSSFATPTGRPAAKIDPPVGTPGSSMVTPTGRPAGTAVATTTTTTYTAPQASSMAPYGRYVARFKTVVNDSFSKSDSVFIV